MLELIIHQPGYAGDHARALLAAVTNKHAQRLAPAFWHRSSLDGPPLNGPALVRLVGTPRLIRLLGLGQAGEALLLDAAPLIMRALASEFGHYPSGEYREHHLRCRARRSLVCYQCSSFVFNLKPTQWRGGAILDDREALMDKIRERLDSALRQQTAWAGYALDAALSVSDVRLQRVSQVPISAQRYQPRVAVCFAVAADLSGPWQIGALQSRGHGFVRLLGAADERWQPAL
ncbi:hypothetical protein [Thiorhodovibrio winogradskyi]|uniref:hypothetical protein n=1 Tax=Thiorhodovibrio winogradskyi TaxID=77007 RepID=UPI002E296EE9|nr:hypothetical protein [Thiorhodovibrio winogradskyi]